MARFYREVADMVETDRDKGHVVLSEEGFQIVIHGIPKSIADSIEISTPPVLRDETPIKICLPVDSIDAARSKAAGLGGQIGAKSREWTARGFTACDGFDPEGNVFQVRESAA